MRTFLAAAAFLSVAALLTGCGLQNTRPAAPHANGGMQGQVMGGQQPVSGALIQLYAVGQGGDGSTATPLLTRPVLTNATGGFNITGGYSCGNATLVYLTATGGDPGLGAINPDLALMTALGPCSNLTASTMVQVNELTTVAATAALYPYMTGYNAIGAGSNDAAALANAFTLSAEFVDPTSGSTPGVGVPAGMVVPSAELNTLANVMAICINSRGGLAGDGSPCGQLFSLTTPPGKQAPADSPTDTIAALLNVALNPTQNTTALFNLSPAASVFQPQLASAPASFTVNLMPASLYFGVNSLSFPAAPVGGRTASQPVTLTNISSTSITVTSLGFAGDGAADYSQTNNCPATLARGVTCTIQVTFAPSSVYAQRNAVLSVSYANTSGTVALSGTALQPSTGPVSVSSASLTFYERTVAQTVTLSNLSANPLVISGINLSAANWTDTTTCGNVLSANSTCTVTITPVNTPGQFSGSLSFVTGDTTDNQTVSLTTDALYTQLISFDYQNETYGYPTRVGAGTTTNPVRLTGGVYAGMSSGYTYYDYTATLGGPSAKDFLLFASDCPTRSGPSCTLQYSFFPTAAGTRYATVVTNANEHFLFEGKAIAGPLSYSVSPAALTFASTALGTSSSVQYLTVTNTSGTVISYARAASSSSEFVLSDYCSGGSPGQTCNISVTFKPSAVGTRTGVLTLKDTTGVTQTLNLTGQGAGGPTAPYTVAFGNVALNASSSQMVSVVIPSQHAAVASISGTSSPFSLPGTVFCATGAATCSYNVTFTPTATGTFTDTLIVTDTVTGYTSNTLLSAAGGIPVVTPSPASLDFGLRNVGQISIPQTVTLTNTGNAPLQVSSVSITGANAADFSQNNTCTGTVAAGATCKVAVTDMPAASGARTASLVIASNGATVSMALTATGN